jgi:hypothetical protein
MTTIVKKFELDGDKFEVRYPTTKQMNAAKVESNAVFSEALSKNALLREQLDSLLEKRGEWNKEKQEKHQTLSAEISELENLIQRGGVKKSQGRDWAIQLRRKRLELDELLSNKLRLDGMTAEGQAQNAYFNKLISLCSYKNGKSYFKDVDDYLVQASTETGVRCASELYSMLMGVDSGSENLIENSFLKRFKYVDDDFRLINEDGHLVDVDGRLVNEDGAWVDSEGLPVDEDGNPLDKEEVEELPWLDDEGVEIQETKEEEKEENEEKAEKLEDAEEPPDGSGV